MEVGRGVDVGPAVGVMLGAKRCFCKGAVGVARECRDGAETSAGHQAFWHGTGASVWLSGGTIAPPRQGLVTLR